MLQDRRDAFHVFVHAPLSERIARVRERAPATEDIARLIRDTDQRRADHIRMYFGCHWKNLHLYHLLVSSELGEAIVARMIIEAIQDGPFHLNYLPVDNLPLRIPAKALQSGVSIKD